MTKKQYHIPTGISQITGNVYGVEKKNNKYVITHIIKGFYSVRNESKLPDKYPKENGSRNRIWEI